VGLWIGFIWLRIGQDLVNTILNLWAS